MTARLANFLGFATCAGLMAYALFAEHYLGLAPCPLCVFQRIGIIATGLVFLVAAIHAPATIGRRVYALLIAIASAATVAVAGRHVWLQSLPPDQVPACGADLSYLLDTVPLAEVLKQVFTGSGECAVVSWSFLGLSMPAWVIVAAALLGIGGILANLRFR